MEICVNLIKSIKNAVIENGIELNDTNSVMWDVCKKEYQFLIDTIPSFYYKMPDGTQCMNINPIFNLKDMMNKSDLDCLKEWLTYFDEHQDELCNMIQHYKKCKNN